ncbi:dihydrofolate reductase [Pleurocapsales cyanobacterium LEGE 10410]|nr:dihydrofolate reductase [Pleurocapsales cyanobacterium LEGE 10410]
MPKVVADIDMSLDGFVAGPNISIEKPLGDGGEQLIWYGDDVNDLSNDFKNHYGENDAKVLEKSAKSEGAVIMGRKTFDISIKSWGEEPPIHKPCFVLTSKARKKIVKRDTSFTFLSDPVEAISKAKLEAGNKNVCVMGGASTIIKFMNSGLLDELHLHLIPVALGDGLRLFDQINSNKVKLNKVEVLEGVKATHILFKRNSKMNCK